MKDIVIIGTGCIGQDVLRIIEYINLQRNTWNVLGFISINNDEIEKEIGGYKILASLESMYNYFESKKKDKFYFFKRLESQNELFTIIAIDNYNLKIEIENKLNNKIEFATIVHPNNIINIKNIGKGSIIYPGLVNVGEVKIGNHVILKQKCSIGNNVHIGNYSFLSLNTNIDSNVIIEEGAYIEANTTILSNNTIEKNSYIKTGTLVY